jgi:putative endonuclease
VDPRHESGRIAEDCAARALQRRGATILHRNYRCRRGELDVVALDGGTLVVVEVRLRARDDYGGAAASVGRTKRSRIVHATRRMLQQQRTLAALPVRFDVAVVRPLDGTADWPVEWIEHAFEAT